MSETSEISGETTGTASLGQSGRSVSIEIDRSKDQGLVEQIFSQIEDAATRGALPAGAKLPSVRNLAKQLGVSAFTVASAYELLAARYVVSARRGAGYFVLQKGSVSPPPAGPDKATTVSDFWQASDVFTHGRRLATPGGGWLPSSWYSQRSVVSDAIRRVARTKPEHLVAYGNPAGYDRLRQHIARDLGERSLAISPNQIVLTNGVTHALDLVVRTCLRPGDSVLVEDPGYSNLNSLLARHGCKLLPVTRGADGLDLEAAEKHAEMHRPKAMFVTTVQHNPLGTTLKPTDAYRLMTLAERFDFLIVEDDIARRFGTDYDPWLAAMDGLSRVISVNGYSKTIAPSLRAGYVACNEQLAKEILTTKMLTGLTTSEITERIVLEAISDPNHRRTVEQIATRMTQARESCSRALEEAGLRLLTVPDGGMFVCAGWPVAPTKACNARTIAEDALKQDIALAPGDFFCIKPPETIWFRFNVAHQDTERLHDFLRAVPTRCGWSA
ncbi:PLP-dependent aminotransferase family protein [Methyloligella sp. 2.7D]|uniref:aminotransferase-like domain-containing protein n=1 Tax=unclassified Methyloligella TaxID=2625955 RepID=UPI00157E0D60|nr:PLP-dependent aminotransferase family protein [Methyloligella sp. GL2]QKP76015.1 PLP-dependent aminotransferase family protein [Methyloligella sp. GL2]